MNTSINIQFNPDYLTYEDGLFLTLNREESVGSSIARLEVIYPYLNAICHTDKDKRNAFRYGLIQLHDHKGQLNVLWRDQKSFEILFQDVERVWKCLGECEFYHYVGNDQNLVREVSE